MHGERRKEEKCCKAVTGRCFSRLGGSLNFPDAVLIQKKVLKRKGQTDTTVSKRVREKGKHYDSSFFSLVLVYGREQTVVEKRPPDKNVLSGQVLKGRTL